MNPTRRTVKAKVIELLNGRCKNSLAPRRQISTILHDDFIKAGIPKDDHWFFVSNIMSLHLPRLTTECKGIET